MSCSDDETNAASVLSQMSQTAQSTASENVVTQQMDNSVIAHQCDVETISSQEIATIGVEETLAVTPTLEFCGDDDDDDDDDDDGERKLQTTLVASSVKVYPCEYCGKVFNKSYNLKTHHRVHSGERPYQCTVCGHAFANLGDLKRHDRTHTGEKPYTCEFCSKSFSDFGSHKRHLRLHTGYKPFKCDKCDREFTRRDSYKNHIRLHTGVRPYKCEECEKEFNYLTTYKRHQNVHSGERPYSCDLCGKKFTRLIYVRNHKLNNCGKEKGKKSHEKASDEMITEDNCDAAVVAVSNASELHEEIKIADASMIENIAHDLSLQGGVQVNVTKVIYTNGGTQPVLIESSETTSHTLILTTDPEDGQQLLEFAASNKTESTVSHNDSSAGTIFLTQSLVSDSQQHTSSNFDAIVTLNSGEQEQRPEVGSEETKTDEGNKLDGNSTERTGEHRDESSSDPSAMYIAIDPTQEIIGEFRVAINSESV